MTIATLIWFLAESSAATETTWIEAVERIGVSATVVLFSFLTGAGVIKWLLNRAAKREDASAKEATGDKAKLAGRVTELEAMVTGKLFTALEQTHELMTRAAEAMRDQAESNNRTAAAMEKMTGLVASMAEERRVFLNRPCLLDPKLLQLLESALGNESSRCLTDR